MPTITLSLVWFLVNRAGEAERLSKPSEITRGLLLVESDPDEFRMEQRSITEVKP